MLQDLNEISDGKIYGIKDMVRAACGDCLGCSACCEGMGESIVLDPLDIFRLTQGTGKTFEQLMNETIALNITEGLILPHLRMEGEGERCPYLDEGGRCSIHAFRPGLCRVFPLGRIYGEEGIRYFLQKEACQKENRSKVKVSRWLDTPELKKNERYLLKWHAFRKWAEQYIKKAQDETAVKTIHLFVLNLFFVKDYDGACDFYGQFAERIKQAEETLH